MSQPNYEPVSDFGSPYGDGQPLFQSPEMTARPWRASSGSSTYPSNIEMQENARPALPLRQSQVSFATDGNGFSQKPGTNDHQDGVYEQRPFLAEGTRKHLSMDSTMTTASVKANTGKQLRRLLLAGSFRWFISFLLCAAWVLAAQLVSREGAVTETKKRIFNAVTTGIALALGLNIASAFKDMALNMRWPILASGERDLVELDLILRADSLTELSKLVFATRRFGVIVACLFWVALNIAGQAGIAAVSLTYGFEVDTDGVLLSTGNVSTAIMTRFYPLATASVNDDQEGEDQVFEEQSYTAHQYGSFAPLFDYNITQELPKAGQRVLPPDPYIFYDNETNIGTFVFFDQQPGASAGNAINIFTNRTINATYECESHAVTSGGNASSYDIEVADVGTVYVSQSFGSSTTFFQNDNTTCPGRCNVIEVFETAPTGEQAWYYRCNITLGETQGDSKNISSINDDMAYYATAAIAQGGYLDDSLQSAQVFPQNSVFGTPAHGDKDVMGVAIGWFTLGAIMGAAIYNPNQYYEGTTPSQGQQLTIGHNITFIGILFVLLLCQMIFVIIVAVWANKVKVGEDSPLQMSVMMRKVADELDDISHGMEMKESKRAKALKKAKKSTFVRYEIDPTNGAWNFKIKKL